MRSLPTLGILTAAFVVAGCELLETAKGGSGGAPDKAAKDTGLSRPADGAEPEDEDPGAEGSGSKPTGDPPEDSASTDGLEDTAEPDAGEHDSGDASARDTSIPIDDLPWDTALLADTGDLSWDTAADSGVSWLDDTGFSWNVDTGVANDTGGIFDTSDTYWADDPFFWTPDTGDTATP